MVNAGEKNYNYFRENGGIFTHHLRVQSFKYYADGALGSRGASLLKPYSDDAGNTGILYFPYDSLLKEAQKYMIWDFKCAPMRSAIRQIEIC